MRSALFLSLLGALVSVGAMISYFTIAVNWPDLRDSGVPNVLLAVAGLLLGASGLWTSFRQHRWRLTSSGAFLLAGLSTFFLVLYIFYLSYQLPPPGVAVAEGLRAPEFSLKDQNGTERSLSEFSGAKVVLVFFRGHW